MAVLSRDEVLARKVHGNVEHVPVGDGEVVVRGLTRGEATETQKLEDPGEVECLALSYALIEPKMTVDDVREWRNNDGAGVLHEVAMVVQRLSGNAPGQAKEATKSVSTRRRRSP